MLSDDADRYIALRRILGYKLRKAARQLQSFARFAADRGEIHVRAATAIAWAATAPTPGTRNRRLAEVILFARFLQAEDAAHELPTVNPFVVRVTRPIPYIYTQEEIPSTKQKELLSSTVNYTFRCVLHRPASRRIVEEGRASTTFVTRSRRGSWSSAVPSAVARHFVALSTYLGHSDIRHTYWYLQATPELMADIAAAAEALVGRAVQ